MSFAHSVFPVSVVVCRLSLIGPVFPIVKPFSIGHPCQYQAMEFIKYISGEISNPIPVEESLEIMRVLDAVYCSGLKMAGK